MWTEQQCAVSVWGKPGWHARDRALVGESSAQLGASLAFLGDTPAWEICPEACTVLLAHTWFGWEGWWWKEGWWEDRSHHKYQLEIWFIYDFWRAKNFIVNTVLEGRSVFASLFCLVDAFVKPLRCIKCISVSKNCFYSCTNEQPLQCWANTSDFSSSVRPSPTHWYIWNLCSWPTLAELFYFVLCHPRWLYQF